MSTIAIAPTTHAQQTTIPLTPAQCAQDYAALQNALQAGDLEAACEAFEAFWTDLAAQTEVGRLFLPNAQTGHDLQTLGHSLKLANIGGARRAFAMFQKDMLGADLSVSHPVLPINRTVTGAAIPRVQF